MEEMDYFYEIFEEMPRQGPGYGSLTLRALTSARPHLPAAPRVLDIGCGSGAQTLTLAGELEDGKIFALDNHRPFLERLEQQARETGLDGRIETVDGDMFSMPFAAGSFDLIWSEGAIYTMGLAGGLQAWRKFLNKDGVMVISDNLWLRRSDNPEVRAFWQEESPEMLDLAGTEARIRRHGYGILDHFSMPREVWRASYYDDLERRLQEIQRKYPGNETVAAIVEALEYEIRIFNLADGDFGYEYWVLRPEDAPEPGH
jgi:SAM-dependent methyltransferase